MSSDSYRITVRALATSILFLGIVVVLGWHTRNAALIQILPQFASMPYNAALGFIAVGFGVFALERSQVSPWRVMIPGALLILLGAVTLAQYLLNWNSGLDELFMRHDVTILSSHPGRMAPNSALCFLVLGLLMLVDPARNRRNASKSLHLFALGSTVLLLGTLALVGYASDVPTAYGWGNLSRMALHTSVGFVASGAAIVVIATLRTKNQRQGFMRAFTIVSAIGAGGILLLSFQISQNQSFNFKKNLAQQKLRILAHELQFHLMATEQALQRLAQRQVSPQNSTSLQFDVDAYFEDIPALQFVGIWNDPQEDAVFHRERDGETLPAVVEFRRKLIETLRRGALRARDDSWQRTITTSKHIGIIQPTVQRDNRHYSGTVGYVAAIIDLTVFLSRIEEASLIQNEFSTAVNVTTLLDKRSETAPDIESITLTENLRIGDQTLAVSVKLYRDVLSEFSGSYSAFIIAVAGVLAILIWALNGRLRFGYTAKQLQTLQDNTDSALITISIAGAIENANAAVKTVFGWPPEDLLGKPIDLLIPDGDSSRTPQWLRDFVEEGRARKMGQGRRIRARHRDGSDIVVDIGLAFISTPDGQKVLATVADVSKLFELEQNLVFEKQRLENTLNSMANGVWGLDSAGNATFINPAACKMLGYDAEELLGENMHQKMHHSYPDGRPFPASECAMYAAFSDGSTHHIDNEALWRKDGSSFPVQYVSTPLRRDGRLVGAVVVFQDISERVRHEELNRKYTAQLESVNQELEEFNYVASHDLREPLRTINSFISFLKEDLGDTLPEASVQHINFIETAVKRMSNLIDDLLTLSRAGRAALKMAPLSLNVLIEQVRDNLHELIRESNAVMQVDPLPSIVGDQGQLLRAFQNLVQNAIKFRGDSVPKIKIYCVEENETHCTVAFQDNGIGVAPKYHAQIFQPFKRLHGKDEYEGSGIGLSVVRKIAERHGGSVRLESSEGHGATFFVTLGK